jgi:hypothetical protein
VVFQKAIDFQLEEDVKEMIDEILPLIEGEAE